MPQIQRLQVFKFSTGQNCKLMACDALCLQGISRKRKPEAWHLTVVYGACVPCFATSDNCQAEDKAPKSRKNK